MRRVTHPELPPPAPIADARELARLSTREREVLALAAGGHLDKQIAAFLGITSNTLRTYWTRIRGKLGEASRGGLVALYVANEASGRRLEPIDGASWHIDVARNVLVFYGDRGLFPRGEIDLDEAIGHYHPDDREKVRKLLHAVVECDMPPFTFSARVIAPHGIETASAYVESVRDGSGKTVRIVGRHVPLLNLSASEAVVGSYRCDLQTGAVTIDAGFRAIFRLRPDEITRFEALYSRLCPEYHELLRTAVVSMIAQSERSRLLTFRLCLDDGDGWISAQMRIERQGDLPTAVTATLLAYG